MQRKLVGLVDGFDLDGKGESSIKDNVRFLACGLGSVFLSYRSHWDKTEFGAVHYEFGFGKIGLLQYHEDRNLICLMH